MSAVANQFYCRALRGVCCVLVLCAPWTQTTAQVTDLMKVYALALVNDPTFLASGAVNRAAQEAPAIARAGLLPLISADAAARANIGQVRLASVGTIGRPGSNKYTSQEYNIQLTQPLYRRDRWIALNQAKVEVEQADTTFAFEEQDLMVRTAERYFAYLRAEDTVTFSTAEKAAFGQQLEQSQQRFEVGLIAITDVEEAKAGFDLATAQVIEAGIGRDNAREALREISGVYFEAIAILGDAMPLEMPVPNDIDKWTETALVRNLQLAGQRYAADRGRMEIQRVEAGHLPTIDLIGAHGRAFAGGRPGSGNSADDDADNRNSSIGVQVNIPIYTGGSVVARTRQSRHLYQRDIDDVERVRRSVQRQTRDSFLGVRSGIARVNALIQAVKSNEAAVNAIEAGFQVGTRTTVDVLNAQSDLYRASRDLADARYLYILDTLELKQAAGNLVVDDLRVINSWLQ